MKCDFCGNEIAEGHRFCTKCGNAVACQAPDVASATTPADATVQAPAVPATPEPAPSVVPAVAPASAPAVVPAAAPAPATQYASAPTPAPAVVPAAAPAPANQYASAPAPQYSSAPSPLKRACDDLKFSPSKFVKILLLSLCGLVPFLAIYVEGYLVRCAKDSAYGSSSVIPKTIFADGAFGIGFKALFTIIGIGVFLGSVLGSISFFIPILGMFVAGILSLVWCFVGPALCVLSALRGAVTGDAFSGFDIKAIYNVAKRKFGTLFISVFLPSLVLAGVTLIAIILLTVLTLIAGSSAMGEIFNAVSNLSMYSLEDALSDLINSLLAIGILAGVFIFAYLLFLTTVQIIQYKAVGYWVSDYASEWLNEECRPTPESLPLPGNTVGANQPPTQ